jgi:hypothetical protein
MTLLRSSAESNAEAKLTRRRLSSLFRSQGGRNLRVGLANNYDKLVNNSTIADIKIPDNKSVKGSECNGVYEFNEILLV